MRTSEMIRSPRPKHITGKRRPDPGDLASQARAERASEILQDLWVDYPGQRTIIQEVRRYMRLCSKARAIARRALDGRRLSQSSQAGKSSTIQRLIFELAREATTSGHPVNPYQVVHITIDERMTLKMLYQEILGRLADDFSNEPGTRRVPHTAKALAAASRDNIKVLEQRVEEWVDKLGVQLIVVDEVQRLYGASADAKDVTKKLQAFLDRGVVPIVFVGDETSQAFFEINPQFASRLMRPLELRPLQLRKGPDRKLFKEFCVEYDRQLVTSGATPMPSVLGEDDVLEAMITVSGGHVGRVARIIQVALPAALERGAITVERYDLSNAVNDFAIGLGWVDYDPFHDGAE